MRKSDFNLKFYTMSYLFCLLNFIFRKVLGFNNEIYLFSWEAYFIHFKMRYCRCFSCKYLLRYELKTECGQFFAFFNWFVYGLRFLVRYCKIEFSDILLWSTQRLNWEILAWCSGDACYQIAFWGCSPEFSYSNYFFNPLSVNLFNSHISFSQKFLLGC